MTSIDPTNTANLGRTYAAHNPHQPGLFARMRSAWSARAEQRRTYRALDALTDRELDDIGLTRDLVSALR